MIAQPTSFTIQKLLITWDPAMTNAIIKMNYAATTDVTALVIVKDLS